MLVKVGKAGTTTKAHIRSHSGDCLTPFGLTRLDAAASPATAATSAL